MQFLVLADFRGAGGGLHFRAGKVLDDRLIDVQTLLADGLAAVPATPENLAITATFLAYRAGHGQVGAEYFLSLLETGGLLGAQPLSTPLQMWVRDTDGKDTNDGRSVDKPIKSLELLPEKIPQSNAADGPILTHIGRHLGAGYGMPNFDSRLTRGNITLIGDGGGEKGRDGFTELQSLEVAGAGTAAGMVVKVGGGLVPDAFKGKTIQLIGGPGAPSRKTIAENTAGEYIPSRNFSPPPDDTTTYRIVEDEVVVALTGDQVPIVSGGIVGRNRSQFSALTEAAYVFAQLKLDTTAGSPDLSWLDANVAMFGVEVDAGASQQWNFLGSGLFMGTDNGVTGRAQLPVTLGLAASEEEWAGWGVGQVGGDGAWFFEGDYGALIGYLTAGPVDLSNRGALSLLGGKLSSSSVRPPLAISRRAQAFLGAIATTTILESTGPAPAMEVRDDGLLFTLIPNLRSVAGALVRARTGGHVSLFGFGFTTGLSTAGKAVDASLGGFVDLIGAPSIDGTPSGSAFGIGGAPGDADVAGTFFAGAGDAIAHPKTLSTIRRVS